MLKQFGRIRVLLAAGVLVVALAIGLYWAIDELRDVERESGATETQRDVLADLNQGNEAVRERQRAADLRHIAALEAEIKRLQADSRAAARARKQAETQVAYWKGKYHEIYQHDASARAWRDAPVPAAVLACVHRDPSCDTRRARRDHRSSRADD